MLGTSMTMVRQYFQKMGVDPDGCMMRALLAVFCDPVANQYLVREVTERHGEVNLPNILNVENDTAKQSDSSRR